jgi:hypothetical protein
MLLAQKSHTETDTALGDLASPVSAAISCPAFSVALEPVLLWHLLSGTRLSHRATSLIPPQAQLTPIIHKLIDFLPLPQIRLYLLALLHPLESWVGFLPPFATIFNEHLTGFWLPLWTPDYVLRIRLAVSTPSRHSVCGL